MYVGAEVIAVHFDGVADATFIVEAVFDGDGVDEFIMGAEYAFLGFGEGAGDVVIADLMAGNLHVDTATMGFGVDGGQVYDDFA